MLFSSFLEMFFTVLVIKDIKKTAPIGAVFINCMSRKCAAKAF